MFRQLTNGLINGIFESRERLLWIRMPSSDHFLEPIEHEGFCIVDTTVGNFVLNEINPRGSLWAIAVLEIVWFRRA